MLAIGFLDGRIPAAPGDLGHCEAPFGDLRLGIALALTFWALLLAPFLD